MRPGSAQPRRCADLGPVFMAWPARLTIVVGLATLAPMLPLNTTRRNLRTALIVLGIFVVVSTSGFYVLGQLSGAERTFLSALLYTASIFSTVGHIPTRQPLTQTEMVWEILMIIFGIGVAVYAFSSVMALVTGGEIQRMLGRRQLTDKMRNLEDHYIVCGFGRMGQGVARALARERSAFIIIDKNSEMTQLADELGYLYVLGDAADEMLLKMARIDRAAGLVSCLPHDADNVFCTLTARELNGKLKIIARAEQEQTEKRLLSAGADRVISPPVIGAIKATRMLLHPAVEEIIDAATGQDVGIDKLSVNETGALAGKSLRELKLPQDYGLMVLAVESADGSRKFNPEAEYVLKAGEKLVVIGPRDAVDRVSETGRSASLGS